MPSIEKGTRMGAPSKELIDVNDIATSRGAQAVPRKPSDDLLGWAAAQHAVATCPKCTPRWTREGRCPPALDWQKQVHNCWAGVSRRDEHLRETGLQFLQAQIDEHGGIDGLPRNPDYEEAPYLVAPWAGGSWDMSIVIKRPVALSGARSLPVELTITADELQRTGVLNLADVGGRVGFARQFPEKRQAAILDWLQDAYGDLIQEVAEVEEPERFSVMGLGELADRPAPLWLVDGVLPQGAVVQVFGPSGAGKSFVALSMALSLAFDEPWLGHGVDGGADVLYVVAEGAASFAKRVEAWGLAQGLNPEFMRGAGTMHFLAGQPAFGDPASVERVLHAVAAQDIEPELIIIDTLAATLGGKDENSALGVQPYIDGLKRLQAETGAAIVLVHHTGHDVQERARGWSGLYAALDVEIRVSPLTSSGALLESVIECSKSKDAPPFEPMTIQLRPVAGSLAPELIEGRTGGERPLTAKAEAMLQLLADASGEVVQTTALRTGLGGVSRDSVNRWGSELTARGLAEQVIDGNASGWRVSVRGVISDASVTPDAPAANRRPGVAASDDPFRGLTPDAGGSGRDAADAGGVEEEEEDEDITAPGTGTSGDPGAPPSTRRIVTLDLRPPTGQRGRKGRSA